MPNGERASCQGGPTRAKVARLLHRRHLLLDGRLALRHVVHLHAGGVVRLSAGFVLHARASRDYARRRMRTHRHGEVELVDSFHLDSFHLDSFHLSLQPLGVGGRHLVQLYHLLSRGLVTCRDKLRRKRRVASPISTVPHKATGLPGCNSLVNNDNNSNANN